MPKVIPDVKLNTFDDIQVQVERVNTALGFLHAAEISEEKLHLLRLAAAKFIGTAEGILEFCLEESNA